MMFNPGRKIKNKISCWCLLAIAVFFIVPSYAQSVNTGSVAGVVKDEDGAPIGGATVSAENTDFLAITDDKGKFTLTLPVGKYAIVCSFVGYKDGRKESNIRAEKSESANFLLVKDDDKSMSEVVVQGMTKKRNLETQGFAVAMIETKEASVRNLTTNELLDRSVGVRVRQNGGIGSRVEYNLNGMTGSTVGLFIDGIEISTYGSSFNLNNIPPSMIERIEVYKGVLPSHLTGDYVGGAINVVMKKDASQNNITAAVSYGSFNTFQSDIGGIYRHKKTGFSTRVSGFYTYTDNSFTTWGRSTTYVDYQGIVTRPFRAKRFNNTYKSIGGRFEFGFTDVKWADQFFLGYNVSDTYSEIPHGTTMATPYVGRFTEFQAHVASLNYNKKDLFVKGLALNVNAVYSSRSTYLQDTVGWAYNWDGTIREIIQYGERVKLKTSGGGQQGAKTITRVDRQIMNARTNLGYTIYAGHRVSLNHKLERTGRDDNDLLNPINKDLVTVSTITKNIVSFNYEAQTLKNRLRTNVLVKYTANKTNQVRPEIVNEGGVNKLVRHNQNGFDDNWGYGATVSYQLIDKLFIIASTENSYVMPTEEQLYGHPENNILPNLDLSPEKNINYNLGFRYGMLEFGKHKLSFYANAFWRNGFNKITREAVDSVQTENDADIQTTRFINLGKTQSRGFETEIIYIYNNRLNASFNVSRFNALYKRETDANGAKDDRYNLQIPNEPFFTINTNIQYRINNVFQKRSILNVYYNTGYVAAFATVWRKPSWSVTPSQFAHDIGASYRFPNEKLVVSIDVKNLLNAELYDNFAVQKPGRGIYLKLNYTINKFL